MKGMPHTVSALGHVLIAFGAIILSPIVVALIEREYFAVIPFSCASLIAGGLGLLCRKFAKKTRNFDTLTRNEGMLIVCLAWITAAAMGAIPYLFYGLSPLDAYFESMSGITTTGATVLLDFSRYPKSFFFWRSLTQWLGGMGIIVLFVAVLPQFKIAGRQMFFAEAPGPMEEKVTPKITQTAKALWFVYIGLTALEILLLILAGMPPFDAVCNSFSTMAAGGFSPHPRSIMGYESDRIVWIIIVFMILAGSNFALQYRSIARRNIKILLRSEEFRGYMTIILAAGGCLSTVLILGEKMSAVDAVRNSLFQIVSILTTTGFATADFAVWVVPGQVVLYSMMLIGGCAGSAGGGIKVVRILVWAKYLQREVIQIIHPRVVRPIKIDQKVVPDSIQQQILGFILFYVLLSIISSLLITAIEGDVIIGLVGTFATIGNIGPAFGSIGPMGSYGNLSVPTKTILILNMVVGRLEIIPFVAMLHPNFWKLGSKVRF
jgi:trk system potassium uptake protein TrkH